MPTILDTPEICDDIAVAPLPPTQPQAQGAHTGFWHTLTQTVGRRHAGIPHRMTCRGGTPRLSMETYQERLAREQPYLYIYAYALCS
jgi:hypothetical protein